MILGTRNFNQEYNGTKIEKEDCFKILEFFDKNGGEIIDTAFNYQGVHTIIKEYGWKKKIITKISKQDEFFKCFDELNVKKLYAVLGRENNLDIREFLKDQKEAKYIDNWGMSLYLPQELDKSFFNIIQIPFDPIWFPYVPIISLYSKVYFRSFYNLFLKYYETKDFKNLKSANNVDFVIGIDNLEQLKFNMEVF